MRPELWPSFRPGLPGNRGSLLVRRPPGKTARRISLMYFN